MKSLCFVWLILISILLVSCTEPRRDLVEDRLERVQVKIDQGLYDESISDLNEILKKDPNNEKARTVLASVYVRRAGIAVKDYFVIYNVFSQDSESEEDVLDLESLKTLGLSDKELKPWQDLLIQVNESGKLAKRIEQKFNQIPELEQSSAKNIYLALLELEKLKTPSAGSSLYRGVIKLLYFKYLWKAQKLIPLGSGQFCKQKISDLENRIEITKTFTVSMIRDVAHGTPKSKADLLKTAQSLEKDLSEGIRFLRGLSLGSQTVAKVLANESFQCDF
jgi:hypothetical protein